MRLYLSRTLLTCAVLCALALPVFAADTADTKTPPMYPVAVFPFQERGAGVKDYGGKISDILFASLSANPDLLLVDRAELDKMLTEFHLNLSGTVNAKEATQIGQLTGAKILVTGSVFEAGRSLYLTAKVIGTETTRVVGEQVKGNTTDDLGALADQLAGKVAHRILAEAGQLVAKPLVEKEAIEALKTQLLDAKKPSIYICINEHHVGQPTVDPAAQTEMSLFCKETGFTVVDTTATKPAPIQLLGEGFSEMATRIGELVSVRARLEVKVLDPATNHVLAIDRQTVIVVDLSEQIAGKSALQKAAAMIAERLLPKLVEKTTEKKDDEKKGG